MLEDFEYKPLRKIAYASISQGFYLDEAKLFKIHYNRLLRIISFTRFIFSLVCSRIESEIIIGNSKIIEFKCLCLILKFLSRKNVSYVNDFFLDGISDIMKIKDYKLFNKLYVLEKSDQELEFINNFYNEDIIIQPISVQNGKKLSNCTVLSVKPILQFPIRYWSVVYRYIRTVHGTNMINYVTFHPRVTRLERNIYQRLFSNSQEVIANKTEFKNVKFYGFYSSVMTRVEGNDVSLIRFDNHRPYEEFLEQMKLK